MGSLSRKPHGFIILSLVMKAQNQNLSNTLVKHGIKVSFISSELDKSEVV